MKKIIITLGCLVLTIFVNAQSPSFQWVKGMGGSDYDYGRALTVDGDGNVYTTGDFRGVSDFDPGAGYYNLSSGAGSNYDVFISKLDANGNFVWAKNLGDDSGGGTAYSIKTDTSGNVYITGSFFGTVDFDPGASTFNLTNNSTSYNGSNIFILKLNSFGDFMWAKQIGGDYGGNNGTSIFIDKFNNVLTTGNFSGTVDFDPGAGIFNLGKSTYNYNGGFILKLDSSGNFVWAKEQSPEATTGVVKVSEIYADALGNIYTTGNFAEKVDFDPSVGIYNLISNVNSADMYILKLDMNGDLIWVKNIGGQSNDVGNSLAVDSSGNIYVGGAFNILTDFDPGSGVFNMTSNGSYDMFILKLNSSGNFVWAKQFGGMRYDYMYAIAIDEFSNVYSTGLFAGSIDFDPNAGDYNLNTGGQNNNAYILKLDSTGNLVWATQLGGGSSNSEGFSIFVDKLNNIYTLGGYSGEVDFDPGIGVANLTPFGGGDIFVQKMGISSIGTTGISEVRNQSSVTIYPNPANSIITIQSTEKIKNIKCLNYLGQAVDVKLENNSIDISSLPKGMYLLNISLPNGNIGTQKFIKE